MKPVAPPPASSVYPIDKYLSTTPPLGDITSLLGDDDWSIAPAVRPEDEIMLKRLHDMLQSTADELRQLSADICRSRTSSVQIRTRPTPMDDEFNEKVHLKEMVEAKFNRRILVDNDKNQTFVADDRDKKKAQMEAPKTVLKKKKEIKVNAGVQVNLIPKTAPVTQSNVPPVSLKVKELVKETASEDLKQKIQLAQSRPVNVAVGYEEYKSDPVEIVPDRPKKFVIQEIPGIQIRSQLKEQKLMNLDIQPTATENKVPVLSRNSVVIEVNHDVILPLQTKTADVKQEAVIRKVVKLPNFESSDSVVKSNSEIEIKTAPEKYNMQSRDPHSGFKKRKLHTTQRKIDIQTKEDSSKKKSNHTTPRLGSEGWKKRLNTIYRKPTASKSHFDSRPKSKVKPRSVQSIPSNKQNVSAKKIILNNAEYVPYSKLTLGGVNVSAIENELANISNKADLPLSPILDKILSSQESSIQESPRKEKNLVMSKPLTKSDEKLLKEVIDIDHTIKKTLNKDAKNSVPLTSEYDRISPEKESGHESYADDFDDEEAQEKSLHTSSTLQSSKVSLAKPSSVDQVQSSDIDKTDAEENVTHADDSDLTDKDVLGENRTYIRGSNLSLKNAVDVFEFVHSVDTQDSATQIQATQKISLKETQTSPRNESSVQPIHNELWNPSAAFDTSGEIDKMFKLEKDFIKNLIMEEYGDVFALTKNINKPSTSETLRTDDKNIASQPKDTQTSPSRVKSVMTSPFKTANRTTSPLRKRLTVQRQHSPLVVSKVDDSIPRSESEADEMGITVNLSSPRFNLRLPQSSRDVLSNLDSAGLSVSSVQAKSKQAQSVNRYPRKETSSEASDEMESDVSSLGEINWKVKAAGSRGRQRYFTTSESSTTSANPSSLGVSEYGVPAKSEGEISVGQL